MDLDVLPVLCHCLKDNVSILHQRLARVPPIVLKRRLFTIAISSRRRSYGFKICTYHYLYNVGI